MWGNQCYTLSGTIWRKIYWKITIFSSLTRVLEWHNLPGITLKCITGTGKILPSNGLKSQELLRTTLSLRILTWALRNKGAPFNGLIPSTFSTVGRNLCRCWSLRIDMSRNFAGAVSKLGPSWAWMVPRCYNASKLLIYIECQKKIKKSSRVVQKQNQLFQSERSTNLLKTTIQAPLWHNLRRVHRSPQILPKNGDVLERKDFSSFKYNGCFHTLHYWHVHSH